MSTSTRRSPPGSSSRARSPRVDANQRRVAKTVNFGVIYGIKPFGLASRLGITQAEAAAFIDAYFDEYASVEAFMNRTLEGAARDGYVETILGRRRMINGIKNTTGRNLNTAERTAVNAVIQGSAADLIKRAMLAVDRQIRGRRSGSPAPPPDPRRAGIRGAPTPRSPRSPPLSGEAMVEAIPFDVPIQVDVAAGPNWLDVATLARLNLGFADLGRVGKR